MSDEKRSSRIREFAENAITTIGNSFSIRYFTSLAATAYAFGVISGPVYTPPIIGAGILGYAILSYRRKRPPDDGLPGFDDDDDRPGPDIDPDLTNLGPRRGRDISLDEAEDISITTPFPDRQRRLQPF
jgi:hypothetical protein